MASLTTSLCQVSYASLQKPRLASPAAHQSNCTSTNCVFSSRNYICSESPLLSIGGQSSSLLRNFKLGCPQIRRTRIQRLRASQDTESSTETEAEAEAGKKDDGLGAREATAAATVATVVPDPEAISRVVETIEQQETTAEEAPVGSFISEELAAIYAKCQTWQWKNKYSINYVVQGSGPAVVLVHGFGASIGHWRR
jgi:hypothetical protein